MVLFFCVVRTWIECWCVPEEWRKDRRRRRRRKKCRVGTICAVTGYKHLAKLQPSVIITSPAWRVINANYTDCHIKWLTSFKWLRIFRIEFRKGLVSICSRIKTRGLLKEPPWGQFKMSGFSFILSARWKFRPKIQEHIPAVSNHSWFQKCSSVCLLFLLQGFHCLFWTS